MSSHVEILRQQFPQLTRTIRGRPLIYLDNAATTLKPFSVIEAVRSYLSYDVANIHRGAHFLGDYGTSLFENVREKVRQFLNANSPEEIVFTKSTTEGLNLLASGLGHLNWKPGDEILLTEMEHHSNIVPWQMMAAEKKLKIKVVTITPCGELDLDDLRKKLNHRVRILSFTHVSNALGTINPAEDIIREAKKFGTLTIVDAAQSVSLGLVDVQKLDCDFLVFSGHKLFGPTGVGVVYGRKSIFNELPPYQGGGSMISQVSFEKGTTYLDLPHRFEAGTPPIAEVIGLGAALDFFMNLDHEAIQKEEDYLVDQILTALQAQPQVTVIGQPVSRAPLVSFILEGAHPSDVGQLLDQQGIAVRTGHHCCQPLMAKLEIPGTVRLSCSLYTSEYDIQEFLTAFEKTRGLLS